VVVVVVVGTQTAPQLSYTDVHAVFAADWSAAH